MSELDARMVCSSETRTEIRRLRGDAERYEDVLRRMIEVYQEHADLEENA